MEKKVILATIGGTVVMFLMGGLIFGLLLSGMYGEWSSSLGDCVYAADAMPIWVPILGSLLLALLFSIIFHKFGATTLKDGAINGAWIGGLIAIWFDVWMFGIFPSMEAKIMGFDLVGNVAIAFLGGAVIGWILGKVK